MKNIIIAITTLSRKINHCTINKGVSPVDQHTNIDNYTMKIVGGVLQRLGTWKRKADHKLSTQNKAPSAPTAEFLIH